MLASTRAGADQAWRAETTEPYLSATLNIVTIIVDSLMILTIIREPQSYFRPYKSYFIAIYAFFYAFPISQLVLAFYPDPDMIRLTTQAFATSAAIIATLWAILVTKLYFYPEKFSIRAAFTNPRKPIHLAFLLYLVPMVLIIAFPIADITSIDPSPSREAFYVLDNTTSRAVGLSTPLIGIATALIVAFTLYPFTVLSRLRSQLRDREVRGALRIIARCFAAISIMLLFGYSTASFGYSLLGLVNLASVTLLVGALTAFKRPTFLRAFLGVVPSLGPNPVLERGDRIVLIYGNEQSRTTQTTRFINEGLNQQDRVLYFNSKDEATTREELSQNGVDVKHNLTKGDLRLPSIEGLYQGENLFDEEAALGQVKELVNETRTLGKNGLRIVIDYADTIKRPYSQFVNHLADPKWSAEDHFVHVMMTFSSRAFEDQQQVLDQLKSRVPVIDLTESSDVFSRTVGLSHEEIAGQKILLEYDPLSGYERILRSLAREAASNFERVVLFTRLDSPIHSAMQGETGLKMFVLTSRVSYPKVESENIVLIPAFDSSLILDSMNKTIEAYAPNPFTIIFDNVSHQIFTLGAERANSFVRQALELMVSNRITGVFLLNYPSHDQKTVSMFENLFDLELVSGPGTRVPEVRKKQSLFVRQ